MKINIKKSQKNMFFLFLKIEFHLLNKIKKNKIIFCLFLFYEKKKKKKN